MILIGIDFSKNSTGVTTLIDNNYHFFSFARDYVKGSSKKAFAHHQIMDHEIDDSSVFSYELLETLSKKQDYATNEANKMINGRTITGTILNAIDDSFGDYDLMSGTPWDSVQAAIEGYSYGSKGNVLIDLVTMTTILKDRIEKASGRQVEVYAPTQVKSIGAGNGHAGKDDMFEAFIQDKDLAGSGFQSYCMSLEIVNGKIPKPIDDVIDSFFVLKTLRSRLES